AMNLVEAEVERHGDGLVARFGEHALELRRGRPGRAILGFRPEDLEDAALAGGAAEGASLTVVPEIREDMGAEVYVHFGLAVARTQEIEVTALVRLQHVLEVEGAVAAPVGGLDRAERGEARGELGRLHLEVESLLVDVEHDRVAVADRAQRAARGGLGSDVQ